MDPDRRRKHPDRARLHRLQPLRCSYLERRGERRRVEDRATREHQNAHRFVEHQDERVVARMRLQAGHPKRSEGRVPKQHAHVSHERDMGMHSFSAKSRENAHRVAPSRSARRLTGILSHFPARWFPYYSGSSCPLDNPPSRPPHRFRSYRQQGH